MRRARSSTALSAIVAVCCGVVRATNFLSGIPGRLGARTAHDNNCCRPPSTVCAAPFRRRPPQWRSRSMTGDEGLPRERGLSTWTTRRWLRVGVAVSLAVLAVLGATGAWVLGRTASISDDLVDVKSPALTLSIRLESAMLNQETGIRGYGLTGTPDFLTPYKQGLTE